MSLHFFFLFHLQTNLQFNNNKFYLIQLLQDDSSKVYSVWMRWGRGEVTAGLGFHSYLDV